MYDGTKREIEIEMDMEWESEKIIWTRAARYILKMVFV
jgi:hypothetical protein